MKNILLFPLFLALLLLDVFSKIYAFQFLGQTVLTPVFFLNIECMINTGIGFSFLSDSGLWHQAGLSLAIGIIIFCFSLFAFQNYKEGFFIWPEILVLSGGLGNLFSRLKYGGVIDFISVTIPGATGSVFNLADCYIFVGLFFLFYRLINES